MRPANKIEHISAMVWAVRSKFSAKLHTATYLRNSAQTKNKNFPTTGRFSHARSHILPYYRTLPEIIPCVQFEHCCQCMCIYIIDLAQYYSVAIMASIYFADTKFLMVIVLSVCLRMHNHNHKVRWYLVYRDCIGCFPILPYLKEQ